MLIFQVNIIIKWILQPLHTFKDDKELALYVSHCIFSTRFQDTCCKSERNVIHVFEEIR